MKVATLVEKAAVVRDEHAGDVPLQQVFQASRCRPTSRWLVGSSSSIRSGDMANASASAARLRSPPETDAGAASGFTEKRCRNSLRRASRAHECALVVHGREVTAQHQRFAQRSRAAGSSGSCSTAAIERPGRR